MVGVDCSLCSDDDDDDDEDDDDDAIGGIFNEMTQFGPTLCTTPFSS